LRTLRRRRSAQTWKNGRAVGKYGPRNQYVYTCPTCRATVTPYYFCAINALDFSIPAVRIGDRKTALKPKTLARVRYGLEKYGRRPLQITANNISGIGCRVRSADEPLFGQTTSNTTALLQPFAINTRQGSGTEYRVRGAAEQALATQTADRDHAIAGVAPWMFGLAQSSAEPSSVVRSALEPMRTQTTCDDGAVVGLSPYMVTLRTNATAAGVEDALRTVSTGGNHALVQPAALIRLMGDRAVSALDAVIPTQSTGAAQNMLVSPSPYMVQYYGQGTASAADDSLPSVTTKHRHALVEPQSLDVNDCYFRMLVAREIGMAMAFPGSYTVLGTGGDQIKQYGNAVTPPAMKILIKRVQQSITGERAA
jgi:DNA (cytosine-5)-methyltransferase 1